MACKAPVRRFPVDLSTIRDSLCEPRKKNEELAPPLRSAWVIDRGVEFKELVKGAI
jgi:hypothetical protein